MVTQQSAYPILLLFRFLQAVKSLKYININKKDKNNNKREGSKGVDVNDDGVDFQVHVHLIVFCGKSLDSFLL